jgi:hypothetical protein
MKSVTYEVSVYENGDNAWHLNGNLHREDGPAIECTDGSNYWYLNGTELTNQEFNERIRLLKQSPDTLTIDGVVYVRKDKEKKV